MQNIPTLKAEPRKVAGGRAAARLRKAGKLPAIVYGHKQEPEPVTLDYHAVELELKGGAHLVTLDIGGRSQPCLFKDAQYDHLGATLLHMDLTRVDLNERVKVRVPLELRGTPKGVGEGGVLRQELMELEVECLVTSIPDVIRENVSELPLNAVLHVKELHLDSGITAITDGDTVVATVRVPAVHEEIPAAAPAEGAAEPEVIAKGKVETEGEGEAEKK
ncbi:MAG: 50S ribosomal protein L25 [Planctomycetota bacterium]|nr:MAG: 50S ribosomal protein L25 [Planctomycetota bacterium]